MLVDERVEDQELRRFVVEGFQQLKRVGHVVEQSAAEYYVARLEIIQTPYIGLLEENVIDTNILAR